MDSDDASKAAPESTSQPSPDRLGDAPNARAVREALARYLARLERGAFRISLGLGVLMLLSEVLTTMRFASMGGLGWALQRGALDGASSNLGAAILLVLIARFVTGPALRRVYRPLLDGGEVCPAEIKEVTRYAGQPLHGWLALIVTATQLLTRLSRLPSVGVRYEYQEGERKRGNLTFVYHDATVDQGAGWVLVDPDGSSRHWLYRASGDSGLVAGSSVTDVRHETSGASSSRAAASSSIGTEVKQSRTHDS